MELGRFVLIVGIALVAVGVFLMSGGSLSWLGRLPGDIRVDRPGFKLFIPITTSILLSALATGVLWLVSKLR